MPPTIIVLCDPYWGRREVTVQGLCAARNFLANITVPVAASLLIAGSWQVPFLLSFLAVPVGTWV